jgi:hypothetical protein
MLNYRGANIDNKIGNKYNIGLMYRLESPPAVEVAVPNHVLPAVDPRKPQPRLTPMYTELFRKTAMLPDVMAVVYARNPEQGDITVVSAPCSTGAEADSLLSLHDRSGYPGHIAIRGMDNNPVALVQANSARHAIPVMMPRNTWALEEEDLRTMRQNLEEYGFDTDFDVLRADWDMFPGHKLCYRAYSDRLRQGRDVTFQHHDLRTEPPIKGEADVVFANNLLYYFKVEEADITLANLVKMVKPDRGIISVGDVATSRTLTDMRMGTERNNPNSLPYGEWLMEKVSDLRRDFGLEPVLTGLRGQPVAFG